ncbi:MAG: hypothetical protein K0R39_3253 [Symbiobacteriaceae bacterium]|jgi:hypothetical protein|nr:hypothetical protein [Symbiobacteriaceae bacterium]
MFRGKLPAMVLAAILLLVALTGCRAERPAPEFDFTLEQSGDALVVNVQTGTFKVPENGHVHIRIDDGPEAMLYKTTYTVPKMDPGRHKVVVELSDPQHNYFGVRKEKEIEIK